MTININDISKLVTNIAESAAEQSTGLGEINTGVIQLDQVTQQNAAMVEQANAAAQLLDNDAGNLAQLVEHFSLKGGSVTPINQLAPASQPVANPAPTSHGEDWDLPPPTKVAVSTNAAGIWEDF